jgi:hypothetical protein
VPALLARQIDVAQRQQEVRVREAAFAKSMADRDLAAFASFISPEAIFVGAGGTTRGPKEIAAAWKRFFDGPDAPFSWKPEPNNGSQIHGCTGAWVPVHRFMVLGFKVRVPGFSGSRVLGFGSPAVEVVASGNLGLSSGPVFDPEGQRIGTFNSTWRRDADNVWRIIFDNGCP